MAIFNHFGVKNFRVFDTDEGINVSLSPITLLTGANNSGKSSVLKAILMLRDSIKHYDEVFDLDLTGKEHFSGNMQNVLHNPKTPDLTISIAFPFLSCNSVALLLKFSSNSRFDKFQTFSSKFY